MCGGEPGIGLGQEEDICMHMWHRFEVGELGLGLRSRSRSRLGLGLEG